LKTVWAAECSITINSSKSYNERNHLKTHSFIPKTQAKPISSCTEKEGTKGKPIMLKAKPKLQILEAGVN